jgi:predicted negative regulator of RcsB-dependent stress response
MNNSNEVTQNRINKVRRIVRYTVAIAASLLLIFVCIVVYNVYRLSSERLFAENYSAYQLTSTGGEEDSTASKIEKAYRGKNYAEAIKINKNSALSVKDIFLTGMAYLETNDLSKAISSYQVVIADLEGNKTTSLKDTAEYYLALAYLKNNDYDQAIELMNTMRDKSSHQYRSKFSR